MKKSIAMLTLSALLMAALPVIVFAHCHGGNYANNNRSGINTQGTLCPVENCNTFGAHSHNGATYGGHHGGGADNEPAKAEYRKITAEEALRMMEENGSYILLDVRTEDEFKEQRIEGSILIPHTEIKDRAEKELPDKAAIILIYCRSGRRSALAANDLVGIGYTSVYDFGGIIDWPYKTVRN